MYPCVYLAERISSDLCFVGDDDNLFSSKKRQSGCVLFWHSTALCV